MVCCHADDGFEVVQPALDAAGQVILCVKRVAESGVVAPECLLPSPDSQPVLSCRTDLDGLSVSQRIMSTPPIAASPDGTPTFIDCQDTTGVWRIGRISSFDEDSGVTCVSYNDPIQECDDRIPIASGRLAQVCPASVCLR